MSEPLLKNIHRSLHNFVKPVSCVYPDPNNARSHGKASIDAIKISLMQYGQVFPILVSKSGAESFTCVAGSGRLTAAKELGWNVIACLEWDGTPTQAKAFALVDNRVADVSGWDDQNLMQTIMDLQDTEESEILRAIGLDEDLMSHTEDSEEPDVGMDQDSDIAPAVFRIIIYDKDVSIDVMKEVESVVMKYGDLVEIK